MFTRLKLANFCVFILLQACNFHEVDPGKFYRSGQMSGDEIAEVIEEYGIKTVINLRGTSNSDWWKDEHEAVINGGAVHHNIRMKADRLPHKEDLRKLIEVYRTAERPILVHCKHGADRAGEATTMYLMEYMGYSKKAAIKEGLSRKYWHYPEVVPSKKYFMKNIYVDMDWAYNEYDPCEHPEYRHYDHDKFCGVDSAFHKANEVEGLNSVELK